MAGDPEEVEIRSRVELRDWLAANHARGEGVWLLHHTKASEHYVPFGEIVSELLCWGWVDAVSRKAPGVLTAHRIAPRKAKSAWSAVNKAKVEEARASGAMTGAGEAAIARAKANGMWSFLDDVERLEVPADLAASLGDLRSSWDDCPRSAKRGTLEWIKTAKTDATREKRIAQVAERLAVGQRPPPSKP